MDDRIEAQFDSPPVAGRFTTLRVRITLGSELGSNSGLAVFCPYSFTLPQLSRPRAAGYVTARTGSRVGLALSPYEIRPGREYERAVVCRPANALGPGEQVEVVFGDRDAGSPGVRAGLQAIGLEVECYRLAPGQPHLPRLPASPRVAIQPGPCAVVRGFATPVLGKGERGTFRLVAEDRYGNRDKDFVGSVRLAGTAGLAGLPEEVRFEPSDEGCKELSFLAEGEGVYHPVVSGDGGDLEAGPVVVRSAPPEYRLFFGELHCHTELSDDAGGTLDDLYDFAQRTACLDFASATDHMSFAAGRTGFAEHAASTADDDLSRGPTLWRATADAARRFHRPGRFVTFLGSEADTVGHAGHRNIYFLDDDVPPAMMPGWPPPAGWLAEWVHGRKALVVPHHPAMFWGPGVHPEAQGLVYGDLPDEIQPVVEIYSRHGTSEYLNNRRPLRGQAPGHFVQDMLAAGHRLGFIAGSDSHQANPGTSLREGGPFKTLQYRSGLAGVWARELTRESIWEAVFARRCFATSYPRFVLWFTVGRLFMGQAGLAEFPRKVTVYLASPVEVNEIEIVRNNEVVHTFSTSGHPVMPPEPEGELTWVDERPSGQAEDFYYIRLNTRSDERAWGSPIFARLPGR